MYTPARTEVMPRALGRENGRGVPVVALVVTNVSVQAFLLLVLVVDVVLDFMLSLDTALTLVPYLLAAAYALRLAITGETYAAGDRDRRKNLTVGSASRSGSRRSSVRCCWSPA